MTKTILVTGGAGFIGHHFIEHILVNTDWNIVNLDRLDFSGNYNRLHELSESHSPDVMKRLRCIFHDLRAEINPHVAKMIGDVDIVAHLAAGSHVDRSITQPIDFVMDNVVGTANILDYARKVDNLERFVYFSTDEVFGPALDGSCFSEYDRYNATNPYSASKAGGEELVVAYENTYGLPAIITHTMNVFGERQHPEKFVPLCAKKVMDNETVYIHADPRTMVPGTRHYVDARDVAEAVLFLLTEVDYSKLPAPPRGASIQKFNVAGTTAISNLDMAKLIAEHQGKELKYELAAIPSNRPGHDLHYSLDGTRMADMGWKANSPYTRMQEVLDWTIANKRWLQ